MKEEILSLSLLRFFAALNVVVVHLFVMLLSVGYLPTFASVFSPYAQYGYLGVDLFFIISGFVITMSSEGRSVKEFVLARFIRLYPVFWLCVCLTTLVAVLVHGNTQITLLQFIANLTMSPDTFGNYAYIDGSYWTLAVELKFYFFIAFLLALKSMMKVNLQKVALALTLLLTIHAYLHFITHSTSIIAYIFALFFSSFWTGYAQYFLAGILFYGIYRNKKQYYHYFAIGVCYLVALVQALTRVYESNNKAIVVLYITSFFLLFLLISLKKIRNEHFSFLGRNYRKTIITLGALTYPLYLLHDSVSQTLVQIFSTYNISPIIASPLLVAVVVSLVLLVNRADMVISKKLKQGVL